MVKYMEYMLHDDMGSMSMNFDTSGVRLDVASLLFEYRKIRKAIKNVQQTEGQSIVIE